MRGDEKRRRLQKMSSMRLIASVAAVMFVLSAAGASAQVLPPSVPQTTVTLPPAAQYRFPANAVNPFQNKSLASPYGACGDSRIPVLIVGRISDSMKNGAGGFIRIVPGSTDDVLMNELREQAAVEHDLVSSLGNQKRMEGVIKKYAAYTPPPASMSLDEYRQMTLKIKNNSRQLLAETQASRLTAIDKDGTFRCNALPPGWYNFVATVLHPEPSGASTKQFGPYTIAKRYFVARAYVPKPVKNRRVIVPVAAFTEMGVVDPNSK